MLELLELLEPLAFALASVAFSLAGAYVDYVAVSTLQSGDAVLAVWMAVLGSAAIYAGLVLFGGEARERATGR